METMTFAYWLTHQFSPEAGMAYRTWYEGLAKPFFAPPAWLFGVAWGLIYPLIGIAFIYTLILRKRGQVGNFFVLLFVLNIILNLAFSPILLTFKDNLLSTASILAVLGTLVSLQALAWKSARPVFWLLLPYLAWGAFASVLQLSLLVLNG